MRRRVFAIRAAARSPKTRGRLHPRYRQLVALTRAVVRDAERMRRRVSQCLRRTRGATRARLTGLQATLRTTLPLVRRVIHQTVARVLHGNPHVPDKVVSLFEPHSEVICKGKAAKPTEFGKLVTIQEAEHQVITASTVHPQRPEYRLFQLHLIQHPDAGDTIRGSGGLRKIRWRLPGRGKRGGARIIYYWKKARDRLFLLFLYPKNVRTDLTSAELRGTPGADRRRVA